MNKNIMSNKQIVTVAVITYHSAATVLETLDSIVNQSYGPENIELIISDDCSKDNTVQVINDWLTQYQTKFHCVKFFVNEINGGISKNCNVVWKAATSAWIKTIAGDDLLSIDSLTNLTAYISLNKNAKCVFGLVRLFPINDVTLYPQPDSYERKFYKMSAREQFLELLLGNVPRAPACFISKEILDSVGYVSESYSSFEDYQLWLKITKSGEKLYLMNKEVVHYRIGESSSFSRKKAINIKMNQEVRLCRLHYSHLSEKKSINNIVVFDAMLESIIDGFIVSVCHNRKSRFTRIIKLISPLKLRSFVLRTMNFFK